MRFKIAVFFLCVTFLIIFIFAAAAKDVLLKKLLEDFVQNSTGCKMEMQHCSVSILKTQVSIKDLIIFNPPGYEEPILLRAPEVYMHFNVFDYFKKRNIHLYTLVLDVREYFFIRNKIGQVNGDALLSAFKTRNKTQAEKEQPRPSRFGTLASRRSPRGEAEGSRGQPRVSIQIDKLTLRIGRIVSKDYSKEAQPIVKEFIFNIDETFDNVQDGYSLVEAVVGKEFRGSIFQQFFKLGVEKITHPVATVKDVGSQAVEKTRQIMMGTVEENQK